MIHALITTLVVILLVGVCWWLCDYLPVPEPLNRVAKIAAVVIGIIAIVLVLLQLADYPIAVRP